MSDLYLPIALFIIVSAVMITLSVLGARKAHQLLTSHDREESYATEVVPTGVAFTVDPPAYYGTGRRRG